MVWHYYVLHILPLNSIMVAEFQWKVWKHKLFYTKCLWISYFFQIFYFIGSSVIYLSLSKIPIWTHQRQFGLRNLTGIVPRLPGIYKKNLRGRELASLPMRPNIFKYANHYTIKTNTDICQIVGKYLQKLYPWAEIAFPPYTGKLWG